ncbi:MAG: DUF3810 domain-containing protein [Lachnospiraceae bacterium]|nr:DUF3810 domain-containing protein [Lachnospiraceae bacterium]
MAKPFLKSVFPGLSLFAASFLLALAARKIPGFAEWYAVAIYPLFVNIVGRFLSFFPFSVVEIGLFLLIAAGLFFLFKGALSIFQKHRQTRHFIASCGRKLLFLSGLLLFIYTLTCGINYHRTPFSTIAGFKIQKSRAEELTALCSSLAEELRNVSPQVTRDENGCLVLSENAPALAAQAMENLGNDYPCLSGYYPKPKLLLISEVLSYQHLSGVYSPFTVEANVNGDMTPYNLPATMCHELSHLKGFMREDEANFIAYLACLASDDAAFRYSGLLFAYIYASNALYEEDPQAWQRIRDTLNEGILADLAANNAFWDRYEGKISELSGTVNDTYLKLNAQTDGIKSYGRMVDLLLAEYRKNRSR